MTSSSWQRLLSLVFGALLVFGWSNPARADRPAPLSAQTLVSPSGATALKGLGESFSANPATGTGAYGVPILLPPGFVVPNLRLSYNGGSGRGELGVGFTLPILQIYRQTDKGSPKFTESDRFAVSGPDYNDELVPVDATRKRYRLKNEGSFALFERDSSNDRWLVHRSDGTLSLLGQTTSSRGVALGKTTRWYVDQTTDVHGHVLGYRYWKDGGRVYLSGIDYQQEAAAAYRNKVDFGYEARPDVSRDFTYGEEVTLAQRVRTIEVRQGTRLLRRYTLGYAPSALWSLLTEVRLEGEQGLTQPSLRLSYLGLTPRSGRFVRVEGFQSLTGFDNGRMTLEDVNGDSLPDLLDGTSTDYGYYENLDGVRFASTPVKLGASGSPDRNLEAQGVVLADVNGDGYRDVWFASGNQLRYYPAGKIQAGRFSGFGAMQVMNASGLLSDVTTSDIRLTDLNGDGRIDMLRQRTGTSDVWLENVAGQSLTQNTIPTLPSGVRLDSAAVDLSDFNGDGILDLIQKEFDNGKHNLKIWYGLGSGKYRATAVDWPTPEAFPNEVRLFDVNGDGQLDFVRISGSWVGYWLNDGRGSYAVQHGDFRGMPSMSRTKKVLIADMNGNGTTDVVWLTTDGGMSYLDLLEEPNIGLLSRVDNGIGMVTDLSYRSSTEYMIDAKLRGVPWLTPMPHSTPVLSEVSISDSLELLGVRGGASRVHYDYRDGYYDGKEHEFRGFGTVISSEYGDEHQEGKVTELHFHVGRNLQTGVDEEVLKGKTWLEVVKTEAGEILSSEEARWEVRWLCQEDLGVGAAALLPSCAGVVDRPAGKDELVALAQQIGILHGTWERQAVPRYTASRTSYDVWGNANRLEEFGEVALPGGHSLGQPWAFADLNVSVGADERVTENDYANGVDLSVAQYVIGKPIEQRLLSAIGVVLTRSRSYYDGSPLVGLPFGQVTRGLLTRQEAFLAEESRWVQTARVGYNADGAPVHKLDATGNRSNLDYDPEAPYFVSAERVVFEASRELAFRGTYDRGYGLLTSLLDPNGHLSQYRYDGLGRLSKFIDPLTTESEPRASYSYSYGTPDRPISVTTTKSLVTRGSGNYRTVVGYSDGFGRTRLVKKSAENGQFSGSGWTETSPLGLNTRSFAPFWSTTADFEAPPASVARSETFFDALGRPLIERLPRTAEQGDSLRSYSYAPFVALSYNEKDTTLGTLRYPTTIWKDGLGRVTQIERKNDGENGIVARRWRIDYDARDRLTGFHDPEGNASSYGYDSLGRLRTLQDANLGTIGYEYDDAGRQTLRSDASGQEQFNEYGPGGRLMRQSLQTRSAAGQVQVHFLSEFFYDFAQPGGPLTTPRNLLGRLSYVREPTGSQSFSYDDNGLLESEGRLLWDGISPFAAQQRSSFVRRMQFNVAGEETHRDLPGGFSLDADSNERGLVRRVRAAIGADTRAFVASASYDERGGATRVDLASGLTECRRYNARAQVVNVLLDGTSSTSCSAADFGDTARGAYHVAYGWGYDGMLDTLSDSSKPRADTARLDASYQYDRLQQLVGATTAHGAFSYSYDAVQNLVKRSKKVGTGPTVEQLLSYGAGSAGPYALTQVGGTNLEYDAAGQLTQYRGYTLSFDAAGRLVRARNAAGRTLEYHYDAWGERKLLIVIEVNGTRRVYRYPFDDYEERDGDKLWRASGPSVNIEVRSSQGLGVDAALLDELTTYVNSPAGKPAPLPQEWLDLDGDGDGFDAGDLNVARQAYWAGTRAGTPRNTWQYIHSNLIGSSHLVTDSSGKDVAARRYEPYGELAERRGVQPRTGYAGAEVEPDEDLGLMRMGARYYASALGRWITPDRHLGESPERMALDPLQSNLYAYSRNNPVVFNDPSGLDVTVKVSAGKLSGVKELKPGEGTIVATGDADGQYDGEVRTGAKYTRKTNPDTDLVTASVTYTVSVPAGKVLYAKDADPGNVDAEDAGRTLREHEYGHAGINLALGQDPTLVKELLDAVAASTEFTLPSAADGAQFTAEVNSRAAAAAQYLTAAFKYADDVVNHAELHDRYDAPTAPVYTDPSSPPDNPVRRSPSKDVLDRVIVVAKAGRAQGEAKAKQKVAAAEKAKPAAPPPKKK